MRENKSYLHLLIENGVRRIEFLKKLLRENKLDILEKELDLLQLNIDICMKEGLYLK